MEIAAEPHVGKGKKIGLDYFFNHEYRKNKDGQTERFHYTWEDKTNSGFWLWGNIFQDLGAEIQAVEDAPSKTNLKNLDVYIIVDPDTPKETDSPNYISETHIKAIHDWVKEGGVLVLMANDVGNVELENFNKLSQSFGITFTEKSRNMVQGNQFEQGKITVPANDPILKNTKTIYIKEISILSVEKPAETILSDAGDSIIAVAKIGKGTVYAIGDPWLYNEYVNGKKLPDEYENFKAAKDLSLWLLKQSK